MSMPLGGYSRITPVVFSLVGGVVVISGLQQLWVGENCAGLTVSLWIDLSSIHVILAATRSPFRATEPGRPRIGLMRAGERSCAVEIDRTADRDGNVVVRGHILGRGTGIAGTRVTLRLASGSNRSRLSRCRR